MLTIKLPIIPISIHSLRSDTRTSKAMLATAMQVFFVPCTLRKRDSDDLFDEDFHWLYFENSDDLFQEAQFGNTGDSLDLARRHIV